MGPEVLTGFTKELEILIEESREFCPTWYIDTHLKIKASPDKTYIPACPLEKIIECDPNYRNGYRNKVEFTIGRSFKAIREKGPICVGFNIGNMAKGILFVEKPDNIKVIS